VIYCPKLFGPYFTDLIWFNVVCVTCYSLLPAGSLWRQKPGGSRK